MPEPQSIAKKAQTLREYSKVMKNSGKISPENRSPNICRLAKNTAESREEKTSSQRPIPTHKKLARNNWNVHSCRSAWKNDFFGVRSRFHFFGLLFFSEQPPRPTQFFPSPTREHIDAAEHYHDRTNTTLRQPTNTSRPGFPHREILTRKVFIAKPVRVCLWKQPTDKNDSVDRAERPWKSFHDTIIFLFKGSI